MGTRSVVPALLNRSKPLCRGTSGNDALGGSFRGRLGTFDQNESVRKMDQSLLYVSRSLIDITNADKDLGDIIEVALARNTELKVTGALIYTGSEFAQILEGTEGALGELMASIHRDKRHTNVTVVYQEPINERKFSKWSMAYSGQATYVINHVRPLLVRHDADKSEGVKQLIRLMEEFVRDDK